jgi:hypothetical protein
MSCGRTSQLESLVADEVPRALQAELRAHALSCAVCRHELHWLETEATLFRQRAGRDEVDSLWEGTPWRKPARGGRRRSAVLAVVASMVVLVWQGAEREPPPASLLVADSLQSDALMSPVLSPDARALCSTLPSGMGFRCSPSVPASFWASR